MKKYYRLEVVSLEEMNVTLRYELHIASIKCNKLVSDKKMLLQELKNLKKKNKITENW